MTGSGGTAGRPSGMRPAAGTGTGARIRTIGGSDAQSRKPAPCTPIRQTQTSNTPIAAEGRGPGVVSTRPGRPGPLPEALDAPGRMVPLTTVGICARVARNSPISCGPTCVPTAARDRRRAVVRRGAHATVRHRVDYKRVHLLLSGKTGTRRFPLQRPIAETMGLRAGDEDSSAAPGFGEPKEQAHRHRLARACPRAKVKVVMPHGLRRMVVDRTRCAGLDTATVASLTGHRWS